MSDIGYKDIKDLIVESSEFIINPPKGTPLPWWESFNKYLNGLRPNELTLLCAPTGAGKTQLLANISCQLCIQEVSHFVAPVETGDIDFAVRIISVLSRKDYNSGTSVPMDDLQESITSKVAPVLRKAKIKIATYDNRVNIEDLTSMIAHQHSNYGTKVFLLDNLNFFLDVVRSEDQNIEMDRAVHELVMLVKKIPIHIILIVHPKKTKDGRVESEFDIKGSSTAVQEAHNVILFNRPKESDVISKTRHTTDRELVFKKIRKRGMYVNKPIWFEHRFCQYEESKKQ